MKKLLLLSVLISGSIFAEVTKDKFEKEMEIRSKVSSCSSFVKAYRTLANKVTGKTQESINQGFIEAVRANDNCKAIFYWQLGVDFDQVKNECDLEVFVESSFNADVIQVMRALARGDIPITVKVKNK